MKTAVLTFAQGGIVTGLYTELIPLQSIGPLEIRRATSIEFNPTTQCWEVSTPESNRVLFTHDSRQVCLDWEHRHFNQ